MLKLITNRLRQGHRTIAVPNKDKGNALPPRFRGRPILIPARCAAGCHACVDACPTSAMAMGGARAPLRLDLGLCTFCGACAEACDSGAVAFSPDHRLAASRREDLILAGPEARLAAQLDRQMQRLLGRSLKLRQVSAGGCNGCEAELVALGNVVFDLGRFGIQFVASPRHADGIVVTGPVSRNMQQALIATYEATPPPRLLVAVGACAISGGPFAGSDQVVGLPANMHVDLYIPGCPPHPLTVLDGLLRMLGRIEGTPAT